jgi:uncharacterized protein YndB with AHSA1/START domain
MSTRSQQHERVFTASPEEIFALLVTPSAIRDWWSAARAIVIPRQGGTWAAAWGESEDAPDYVTAATIAVYQPPRHLRLTDYQYLSKDGPLPFEADFSIDFIVEPRGDGALLRVVQHGFPAGPEADEFYRGCEQGWTDTLAGIRRFLGEPEA